MKAEIYKDEGFELMGALLQLNSITISVGAEWSSGQPGGLLVLCLLNGWCFVAPSLACGEARGGSIPRSGAVTDEQRSHRPNWAQPKGRQSFSLQPSLLTPYRSTSGYARRSRLAWTENPLPQNTSHLGDTTLARASFLLPLVSKALPSRGRVAINSTCHPPNLSARTSSLACCW